MKPRYRSPKEIAKTEHKERISLMVPKDTLEKLRKIASKENITVTLLINEAIRGYLDYLDFEQKP